VHLVKNGMALLRTRAISAKMWTTPSRHRNVPSVYEREWVCIRSFNLVNYAINQELKLNHTIAVVKLVGSDRFVASQFERFLFLSLFFLMQSHIIDL
jgi:hypothetical protein